MGARTGSRAQSRCRRQKIPTTVMARRAPTPGGRATLAPLPSSETIQRRGTTPSPPSTAREWQRCEDRSATSPHCARCSPTLLLTPLRRPLVHHRTTPTRPARHLSHTSLHRTSAQPRHANSTPLCHHWPRTVSLPARRPRRPQLVTVTATTGGHRPVRGWTVLSTVSATSE